MAQTKLNGIENETLFANQENFQFVSPNKFKLSSIIKWYANDFGGNQAEQLRALAPYMPSEQAQSAALRPARVSYLSYNWNLNERKTPVVQEDGSRTTEMQGTGSANRR